MEELGSQWEEREGGTTTEACARKITRFRAETARWKAKHTLLEGEEGKKGGSIATRENFKGKEKGKGTTSLETDWKVFPM